MKGREHYVVTPSHLTQVLSRLPEEALGRVVSLIDAEVRKLHAEGKLPHLRLDEPSEVPSGEVTAETLKLRGLAMHHLLAMPEDWVQVALHHLEWLTWELIETGDIPVRWGAPHDDRNATLLDVMRVLYALPAQTFNRLAHHVYAELTLLAEQGRDTLLKDATEDQGGENAKF